MSTLEQLSHGLNRMWDNLSEGWQHLRERSAQALTRFNPVRREVETPSDQLMLNGARWGFLTAEVQETTNEVIVRMEAAGLEADDFDLSVVDDCLVIRGDKQARREHNNGRYSLLECAYGRFERAIPLPASVDEARTQARYRRGVLSVTLPKRAPTPGGRRININAG